MKKLTTLFLALSAAICCMASKPVTLTLNLEKGGVYGMNMETSSTINQNVMGQSVDMLVTMNGECLFQVNEISAEGYDMSVRYDRMSMKMSGAMDMEADSDNLSAGDPLSAALKAMTDVPFRVKMTRSGKILSVEGVEEMIDAMVVKMKELFPDMSAQQIEMMKTQLNGSYGGESFKGSIESGISAFPDKPVSVGDNWNDDTRMHAQFTMDVERVFTVTAIDDAGVRIKCEATIVTDPDGAPVNMSGMEAKYDVKGTMTSETLIDPATGWTLSGKTVQDVSGTVKILPNGQMPNGFSIPLTMKTDITVTGSKQ